MLHGTGTGKFGTVYECIDLALNLLKQPVGFVEYVYVLLQNHHTVMSPSAMSLVWPNSNIIHISFITFSLFTHLTSTTFIFANLKTYLELFCLIVRYCYSSNRYPMCLYLFTKYPLCLYSFNKYPLCLYTFNKYPLCLYS